MSVSFDFQISDVSAFNLPALDITTSDPYVVFDFASSKKLKTEVIPKQLNAVFTFREYELLFVILKYLRLVHARFLSTFMSYESKNWL